MKAIFASLTTADYFAVKEIIIKSPYPAKVDYLKGKNIFRVDLDKEANQLSSLYPDFKTIRLVRILPDKLYVDFIKRSPLAYVKLYRYFCLDSEGVLFDLPQGKMDLVLPVVTGLDTKIFGVKAGRKYSTNELLVALSLLKEIKKNRYLTSYRVDKIDVSDPANTSLYLSVSEDGGPIEVKMGLGNVADKVNILASLIFQSSNDRFNIKYIDLRFKEPVIKLKDMGK